jgi:hypothetical protein
MKVSNLFFLLLFSPVYWSAFAQQSSPGKENNFAGVNVRGDQGMGFSHEKTTHHFHLLADGGAIEIQSNEPADAASQEAIRQHLAMIAVKFSQSEFFSQSCERNSNSESAYRKRDGRVPADSYSNCLLSRTTRKDSGHSNRRPLADQKILSGPRRSAPRQARPTNGVSGR